MLTGLLLPRLARPGTGPGRDGVVDRAPRRHRTRCSTATSGETYNGQKTYQNSKLANLLFAMQLHRELTARQLPVTSTAAHPGVSATGLFSSREGMGASFVMRTFAPPVLKVLTQSSAAGARADAVRGDRRPSPARTPARGRFGETRGAIGPARRSSLAQDEKLARRLWQVSEELTGFRYDWASVSSTERPEPAS